MHEYNIVNAQQDWPRFIKIFNRSTVYAPYTIPLDEESLKLSIIPACDKKESFCVIGYDDKYDGIIHAEKTTDDDKMPVGAIHLLFSNSNNLGQWLVELAESWFKENQVTQIKAFGWYPNPYTYILYGAETYAWAGAAATINAFRRLNYDIELDIVAMSCDISDEPVVYEPVIEGLNTVDKPGYENELVSTGCVSAEINGKNVGSCGYLYLKAISRHFGKGIGQIWIYAVREYHKKGIGEMLITSAHKKLYGMGARKVNLTTSQTTFRAIKFYEKIGYKPEALRGYTYTKEL